MRTVAHTLKFLWPGRQEAGLTLIEMIASLVLVSMLVAIAGVAVVNLSESFIFVRATADTTQKAQMAMARMTKEFEHITETTSGNATQITFEAFHPDALLGDIRRFTLSWDGTAGAPLYLISDLPSGSAVDILVDQVVFFELRYIYYDTAGNRTIAASRTPEWTAAMTDPARQAALGLRLKLVSDRMDEMSTLVFLGKHD
jgi:prepilin-type N-terminal cleavage/methylation domain-containing protein